MLSQPVGTQELDRIARGKKSTLILTRATVFSFDIATTESPKELTTPIEEGVEDGLYGERSNALEFDIIEYKALNSSEKV